MSETAASTDTATAPAAPVSVVVDDVHVTYRVYEDRQRPTLRRLVSRGFRARPARTVHAVRGVSFEVRHGEALGLIGRNGSGKSSLLRVIAGLLSAESGHVYAGSSPVLLGVGAVLHPELSGRRNVYLGGTALGMSRSELEARFDDIVEFSGVGAFIDMPLKTYSSGMKARLQFSIASTVRPEILLIDEALSVGDAEFRKKSQRRIADLTEKAGTVILVSHSMQSIEQMCQRAIWLDDGRIVAEGPVADVVARYSRSSDG